MKLSIVTAVCGAIDITEEWFAETIGRCRSNPEVVVVSNGNAATEVKQLARLLSIGGRLVEEPDPLGSTRAFNRGLRVCTGDVVAMLHNDLMMKSDGWDLRVLQTFRSLSSPGVMGLHGSRRLGHPLLYQIPYELHQLARGDNFSNLVDAESHGSRTHQVVEVVTLDGMALIASREDLAAWGGLDERYVHHCYDHDLCTTARQYGRRNFVVPESALHVSGQTANSARYQDALGPDAVAHKSAHIAFYEKWRGSGLLPAKV